MSKRLLLGLLATSLMAVPLANPGLRHTSPSITASNSTANMAMPLHAAGVPGVVFDYASYWDGQCTSCPAYLYGHCSQGGRLIGERGCGTLNVYCEGHCSVPSPPPLTPAPPLIPAPSPLIPAPAPISPAPAPTSWPLPADETTALLRPSNAEVKTFHMYRAQGSTSYPPSNVNTGNLAGVMWYLQHEVVSGVYSSGNKFGITRIIRYTVKTKATQPLIDRGMNFGVRVAFDSGECTGPQCDFSWQTYGYNVGCNNLGDYPFPDFETNYTGGIWYSLPGECPSMTYRIETDECKLQEPGGRCSGTPTGTADCTWSYEDNGEQITLEELYNHAGSGTSDDFWGSADNTTANSEKVRLAATLFANKYGDDHSDPICDFSYGSFYPWER